MVAESRGGCSPLVSVSLGWDEDVGNDRKSMEGMSLGSAGGGKEDIEDTLCRGAIVLLKEELDVGLGMDAVAAGVEYRSDVVVETMMAWLGVVCVEAAAGEWKAAAGLGGDSSGAGWKDSEIVGPCRSRTEVAHGVVSSR